MSSERTELNQNGPRTCTSWPMKTDFALRPCAAWVLQWAGDVRGKQNHIHQLEKSKHRPEPCHGNVPMSLSCGNCGQARYPR